MSRHQICTSTSTTSNITTIFLITNISALMTHHRMPQRLDNLPKSLIAYLALIVGLQSFREDLLGRHAIIMTDHQALLRSINISRHHSLSPGVAKVDCSIAHIPGHSAPDALSQMSIGCPGTQRPVVVGYLINQMTHSVRRQ